MPIVSSLFDEGRGGARGISMIELYNRKEEIETEWLIEMRLCLLSLDTSRLDFVVCSITMV